MSFDERDVNGLQTKLQGLNLTEGERAALEELVIRAAGDGDEVEGFGSPRPRVISDLTGAFTLGDPKGTTIVPWLSSGHTTGSNITDKSRIG